MSFGKTFLFSKNTGSVAVLGYSGDAYLDVEEKFQKDMYASLNKNEYKTIGELFIACLNKMDTLSKNRILLGDPAMLIAK